MRLFELIALTFVFFFIFSFNNFTDDSGQTQAASEVSIMYNTFANVGRDSHVNANNVANRLFAVYDHECMALASTNGNCTALNATEICEWPERSV